MRTSFVAVLSAALAVLALRPGGETRPDAAIPPEIADVQPFLESYASLLHAAYADAAAGAAELREAVDRFAARPTADGLESCKAAWLRARPAYLQTEIARFCDGPIEARERFLNAWPLDESYVDGVRGDPAAGLINDPARLPRIDADALRAAHEQGGETHLAVGWHAIEFLLWGQDLELGPGGGRRSHLDFVPGRAANAERRTAYLQACARMLVADLEDVRDQWAPDRPLNYRRWFTFAASAKAKLSKVFTGVGTLAYGELRGERLVAPFTLKDRENEHSCFSDTTHLDHLHDMLGARNVWEGRYRSRDGRRDHAGPGLRDLARKADPALAREVERSLAEAVDALSDPALAPFELAILGDDAAPGRRAIQRALDALGGFNRALCALAARLGAPIATTLPR
jgi:putative iron-regulated protein